MSSPMTAPQTTTTTWNLDPVHSVTELKHMIQFTGISGVLDLDEADIANSSVEAPIDATSVNTRAPQRDAHLKSPDFSR